MSSKTAGCPCLRISNFFSLHHFSEKGLGAALALVAAPLVTASPPSLLAKLGDQNLAPTNLNVPEPLRRPTPLTRVGPTYAKCLELPQTAVAGLLQLKQLKSDPAPWLLKKANAKYVERKCSICESFNPLLKLNNHSLPAECTTI